jgi:glycosyltransferase involved in cell wall biosynthesis
MTSLCVVVQSFYDIDARVRRKAEALVAAGYSVDVLALRPPGGKKNYELNGVNIRTLSLGKQRGSLGRYVFEYAAFFLWALVRLPWQMRKRRYAAIDVNTLPDFLIFAAVLGRWMGAKLILDMHEITPEFYMSKYGISERSWVVRFLKFQERISFNFADHVVTINEPIQDLLTGRGMCRSRSTVIMNAADEARFAAGPSSLAAAKTADGPGAFVMMYHGTLTRIYGLDIAVEALAIARDRMPGAELWILGSGPEAKPLATLVAQRGLTSAVKLVGQVAPAEIRKWLDQCTVGVLPIRRDVFLDFAFPNKLPEFIITGKAVMVSRLRAINHYFTDEALAYAEPNSPNDLANVMVRMYENPRWREKLTRQAEYEYNAIRWDVMKGRYLAMLAREIGSGPGSSETREAHDATVAAG